MVLHAELEARTAVQASIQHLPTDTTLSAQLADVTSVCYSFPRPSWKAMFSSFLTGRHCHHASVADTSSRLAPTDSSLRQGNLQFCCCKAQLAATVAFIINRACAKLSRHLDMICLVGLVSC